MCSRHQANLARRRDRGSEHGGALGIREFFTGADEAPNKFHLAVESLRDMGEGRVVAFLNLSMESRGGVSLTQPLVNVYHVVDGKLHRVHVYRERDEALKALGLEA